MVSKSETDKALDRIELAMRELAAAVSQLTVTIALHQQSIGEVEKKLDTDGGLVLQVKILQSDVQKLDGDFNALRREILGKSEKWGDRAFDIFKIALPWLCAVGLGWVIQMAR